MKWTVSFPDDGTDPTVTDHNGNEVTTISRSGGITVPDDVLDVMFDTALTEYDGGNVKEALTIVAIIAGEQIEVIR